MKARYALMLLLLLATSCREELQPPYDALVIIWPAEASTGPSPTIGLVLVLNDGTERVSHDQRVAIANTATLSAGGTPVPLMLRSTIDTGPGMAEIMFDPVTPLAPRWYTFEIDLPTDTLRLMVGGTLQRHDATSDHYAARFFAGSLPLLVATLEVDGTNPEQHRIGVAATERVVLGAGLRLEDLVHVRASGVPVTCSIDDPSSVARNLSNPSYVSFLCTGIASSDVVDVAVDRGLSSPTGVELRDFEGRSGPATVTFGVGQHVSSREPSAAVLAIGAM